MKNKILLIDKPKGVTSHDVVDEVRRITGESKVGHAGTLDPMATGLLVVLVGSGATKRQNEFMGMEKEYVAEITFGLETDTYDAEGEVVGGVLEDLPHSPKPGLASLRQGFEGQATNPGLFPAAAGLPQKLSKEKLQKKLNEFRGKIKQEVPPYSAVKVDGKPLYKYAREGRLDEVELPTREVKIKEIELLSFKPFCHFGVDIEYDELCVQILNQVQNDRSLLDPTVAKFLPKAEICVVCSKGTYIRSLAHDLGQKLGTGAFLSALRRTRIGDYSVDDAVPLFSFSIPTLSGEKSK